LQIFCVVMVTGLLSLAAQAQSEGPRITQSVVAGGGATSSSGTRQVEGTAGQSVTRTSSGGTFSISSGFWSADASAANTVVVVSDVNGTYGGNVSLSATLSSNSTGIANKTITFKLNGTDVGTATTDTNGLATIPNVSLSGINAGSYPSAITARFDGDETFAASSASAQLTVQKATQTITFDPLSDKTFGDPDFTVSASASSNLSVGFNAVGQCTVSGSTVHLTAAGSCSITASQSGDTNYNAATDVTRSFQIAPVVINLSVNDAQASEPGSGARPMLFVVSLSTPAGPGGVSVHYSTFDQSAGSGHAVAGVDYTPLPDSVLSFVSGEQFKTVTVNVLSDADAAEPDETFLLNLSNPAGATMVKAQAVGTIKQGNVPGTFLISEFRTSGTAGPDDDFVEFYNNTDTPLTIAASDASGGYGLFKTGSGNASPVLIGTIPNGTVIPARGHYLMVGSAYSLTASAPADLTLSSNIEDDANLAVFTAANVTSISSLSRLDAVGFTANAGGFSELFREGTNLPALGGSNLQSSFQRDPCGKRGLPNLLGVCPSNGLPVDTNDNNNDFLFADVNATMTAAGQRLGAPGPESLGSPVVRNSIPVASLDPLAPSTGSPNRVRDLTPDVVNNSTFGTLAIRRTITNNTGSPITRLRFRIIDITSLPSGGLADMRARSSSDVTVAVTGGGLVNVVGTTLETPVQPLGGALNSTLGVGTISLGTPLASGASINIQFLLGVQQTGSFKFFINVEALP
jgi:hypothetical protein